MSVHVPLHAACANWRTACRGRCPTCAACMRLLGLGVSMRAAEVRTRVRMCEVCLDCVLH